jgi:hypothetical protein
MRKASSMAERGSNLGHDHGPGGSRPDWQQQLASGAAVTFWQMV